MITKTSKVERTILGEMCRVTTYKVFGVTLVTVKASVTRVDDLTKEIKDFDPLDIGASKTHRKSHEAYSDDIGASETHRKFYEANSKSL